MAATLMGDGWGPREGAERGHHRGDQGGGRKTYHTCCLVRPSTKDTPVLKAHVLICKYKQHASLSDSHTHNHVMRRGEEEIDIECEMR